MFYRRVDKIRIWYFVFGKIKIRKLQGILALLFTYEKCIYISIICFQVLDKCKSNDSCGEGYCCAFNFQHNFGYCMPNRGLGEKCSVTYMVSHNFSNYIAWSSLALFKLKVIIHRIPKREFCSQWNNLCWRVHAKVSPSK